MKMFYDWWLMNDDWWMLIDDGDVVWSSSHNIKMMDKLNRTKTYKRFGRHNQTQRPLSLFYERFSFLFNWYLTLMAGSARVAGNYN